jgi:DNA-binding response OmpR family regulator
MVERDPDLASVLSAELRGNHFVVDVVCQWEQAAEALRGKILYDLLMLDLVEEHGDSLALIHRLRPILPSLPMLVLTPRNNVQDKVCAFEAGADDCLSKPLALTELLARIRALVRRKSSAVSNCSRVADLVLHREERTVERNGRRIDLTPREFALLDVMMRNAGKSVSRVTLLSEVWNLAGQPSTNIVDVYMKYVRDKVDLTGEAPLIHTLRGFGYVIRES